MRAYAINSEGTAYGDPVSFTTDGSSEITYYYYTDERDTKEYKYVKIGEQYWMAENLAYLPSVYVPQDSSSIIAKYYVWNYFGTDPNEAKATDKYDKYGVLYKLVAGKDASQK